MGLKSDGICGIHTSKESCWICGVFQQCGRMFMNDFEAVGWEKVKPEDFMESPYGGEKNLI